MREQWNKDPPQYDLLSYIDKRSVNRKLLVLFVRLSSQRQVS